MGQHYTRNTVQVSEWCKKCGKPTMHRVDGVKLGPCLVCLNRVTPQPQKEPVPEQLTIFVEEVPCTNSPTGSTLKDKHHST